MSGKCFVLGACFGAAVLLSGCQSLPPGAEPGPDHTMAYYVQVEASPPGARIEANGEDLGAAPLRLKIWGDPDGTFHDFGSEYYIIRGVPIATNQFPQVRVFGTGHMFGPEDHIPNRIYFDMDHPMPYPPAGAPAYVYPYGPPPPYGYYGAPYYYGPYYGPSFRFYYGPRYHRRW